MSKWQLTLIQNGKKLRKFGECKSMIYLTMEDMLSDINSHVNPNLPFEFIISRYNNINNPEKKVVEKRVFNV